MSPGIRSQSPQHTLPHTHECQIVRATAAWLWCVLLAPGAADATAQAYAEELARQGVSLVFVSPGGVVSPELLKALSQRYGVEVTLVEADLALGDAAAQSLSAALEDKDVGILVNCGARCPAGPGPLAEAPEQGLLELVNRAVVAAALMTRLLLPGMLGRGRGAVVQLGSGAGSLASGAALFASQVSGTRALLDLTVWHCNNHPDFSFR